jgi:hypothetical protein
VEKLIPLVGSCGGVPGGTWRANGPAICCGHRARERVYLRLVDIHRVQWQDRALLRRRGAADAPRAG